MVVVVVVAIAMLVSVMVVVVIVVVVVLMFHQYFNLGLRAVMDYRPPSASRHPLSGANHMPLVVQRMPRETGGWPILQTAFLKMKLKKSMD